MGGLTESKLGSVRMLIQLAPDSAIRDLAIALSSDDPRQPTTQIIRGIVNAEALDRRARNTVFAPLMPLCGPTVQVRALIFPSSAPAKLWRGLKEEAADDVQRAIRLVDCQEWDEVALNRLCARAAVGLRAGSNSHYEAAAATLNTSTGGAEAFAACLDLVPIARGALEKLPEWLGRQTEERVAAARLAFRDAVEVSEDAGPRLLEILYAHLEEPWLVLRLVSALMHRPTDQYVANSELASFGERLLDNLDVQLQALGTFNIDEGVEAGRAASRCVRAAAMLIAEFDEGVDLSREGPWGSRIARAKRTLALGVEGRLKVVETEVAQALPLGQRGKGGTRGAPRLTADPDQRSISRALALLTFMQDVRMLSDRIGSGATWTKTSEALAGRLDTYVEDLLEKLRAGDPAENLDRVRQYLDIAAEFLGLASDEKAAQIVRRRVAAA